MKSLFTYCIYTRPAGTLVKLSGAGCPPALPCSYHAKIILKRLVVIGLHLCLGAIFACLLVLCNKPALSLSAANDNPQAMPLHMPLTHTLSVNVFGNGVVLRSPAKPFYLHGEQVELTAIPMRGQSFLGWRGDIEGQAQSIELVVKENKAITAIFSGVDLRLSLDALGAGIVQAEPAQDSYAPGTLVTLTAVPASGWQFAGWNDDLGVSNPLTLMMHRNRHIVATFVHLPHTLSLGPYTHGRVVITPEKERYQHGDIVTLTAIPDAGYYFVAWQVNQVDGTGEAVITDNPTTLSITASVTYTPHFSNTGKQGMVYLPLIASN